MRSVKDKKQSKKAESALKELQREEELYQVYNEAVTCEWYARFQRCDELLQPLAEGEAVAATLYAESMWLRALITEDEQQAKETFRRIDVAQKLCCKEQQSYVWKKEGAPRTVEALHRCCRMLWAKVSLAEATLYDGFLKFRNQQHLRAVYNIRKSWKLFEECQQLSSRITLKEVEDSGEENKIETAKQYVERLQCSINFGVGFFHFMISVIPPQFLWMVEIIGFKAHRKKAMLELKAAARVSDGLRSPIARFMLMTITAFFLEDEPRAEAILRNLLDDYPESPIFDYVGAWLKRSQGNVEEAQAYFEKAYERCEELPQFRLYTAFEMGSLKLLQLRWDEAAEAFATFLATSETKGFKAFGHYQLAMCYIMMDEHSKALDSLRQVNNHIRKGYSHDELAGRKATMYIKKAATYGEQNIMSPFDKLFFQARMLLESRMYEAARPFIEQMEEMCNVNASSGCDEDAEDVGADEPRMLLLKGYFLKEQKRIDEAEQVLLDAVEKAKTSKTESFVTPWGWCALAEIELKEKKDVEKAAEYFKRCSKYSNYDWEGWIHWRVKRGQDRIRQIERKDHNKQEEEEEEEEGDDGGDEAEDQQDETEEKEE
ncbi:hypothetical protein QOT17_021564 [Balamuthia mandrillaris]